MPELVEVRTATLDDCKPLIDFGVEAFSKTFGQIYSKEALTRLIENDYNESVFRHWIEDSTYCVLIAFTKLNCGSSIIVGYSVASICTLPILYPSNSDGEIKKVYVDTSIQNSHVIAYKLFDGALNWLKRKYNNIYISVYEDNITAQKFYSNFGFQLTERCKSDFKVVLLKLSTDEMHQNSSTSGVGICKPKRKPPPPPTNTITSPSPSRTHTPPPSTSDTVQTPVHSPIRVYTSEELELLTLLDIGIVDFNAYIELESPLKHSNHPPIGSPGEDYHPYSVMGGVRDGHQSNSPMINSQDTDLMPSMEIPL